MMNINKSNMAGNTLGFAAFRSNVAWLVMAAWIVANGVAVVALLWVVVNTPEWMLITCGQGGT